MGAASALVKLKPQVQGRKAEVVWGQDFKCQAQELELDSMNNGEEGMMGGLRREGSWSDLMLSEYPSSFSGKRTRKQ